MFAHGVLLLLSSFMTKICIKPLQTEAQHHPEDSRRFLLTCLLRHRQQPGRPFTFRFFLFLSWNEKYTCKKTDKGLEEHATFQVAGTRPTAFLLKNYPFFPVLPIPDKAPLRKAQEQTYMKKTYFNVGGQQRRTASGAAACQYPAQPSV